MPTVGVAKVIKEQRSLYRNIFVEDKKNIRCLKFSVKRRVSSQSCIDKQDPNRLVFDYTKFVFTGLLVTPNPEKVLIIGLGGGTLSNSLQMLFPDIQVDNIEIDPAVVDVAREYFDFKESENIRTFNQDGRIFIKRAAMKKQQYDLIILDAFNGEYIPEHLLTREFLQETKSLLTDNGVVVANTFSSSLLYHHETATYHDVFGDFYSVAKGNNSGNRIILAGKHLPDEGTILNRVKDWQEPLQQLDIDLKYTASLIERQEYQESSYRVLTDQYSPANLLQ
ncbi:methyltransferase domain-containing protein [Thalassotalea mangrovi]|uniref:Methyltransferase domain-containing protein n=1 Tax=Thalassotalea mangrovi TaxID=2572245 RepID=A0A4U1B782_9GAMM|nr:fused MFS/spermidine synthase [Thalassotalea mangrovi]TKB46444.1 methyltransferase domain-containing protein [Thalassotalea mangrovi]